MTEKTKKIETKVKVPIITQIQNELKAPKNQWNNFGKYNYRNAEDIESALKPLLAKYGAQLTFDEEYRQLGERIYAVEIANYKDSEQEISVQGWAREAEHKKGMDESQISGSTSSYAIKNVLGKLFLIDDTKDADSQKPQKDSSYQQQNQSSKKKPTKKDLENYPITYKGVKTTMGILYQHYQAGEKDAVDFANSLNSSDKFVFENLKQME